MHVVVNNALGFTVEGCEVTQGRVRLLMPCQVHLSVITECLAVTVG